ncbi:signal peptidase II [Patescibacteria group bacterium]
MRLRFGQQILIVIIVSLLVFVSESIIKYYLILNKIPEQGFYFFKFLQIGFYPNQYIAFGLPLPQAFTIILVILILIILSFIWWKSLIKKNIWQFSGISIIILGALSNLLDRLTYGYVIDYLNIFIWPVFNFADVMIVVGVLLYLFSEFLYKPKIKSNC